MLGRSTDGYYGIGCCFCFPELPVDRPYRHSSFPPHTSRYPTTRPTNPLMQPDSNTHSLLGVMPVQSLPRSLYRLKLKPLLPFSKLSSSMSSAWQKPRLRGVVFDMDGTLTIPVIDFPAMYRAVLGGEDEYARLRRESPTGIDILHLIEGWPDAEQRRAYQVIAEHEKIGLDRLQIMPGAVELCGFLDSKRLRRGLITRNVQEAVNLFHQRFGIAFSPALSREFRPYKPDPAPLLYICSNWEIQPNEVMMVGDSVKDDIVCGKSAGAFTCLLDQTGRYNSPEYNTEDLKPDFKDSPRNCVDGEVDIQIA